MKTWQKFKQNPVEWEIFFIREEIIKTIRKFFWEKNFHEVETPLLVSSLIPEPTINHFETVLSDCRGMKKQMFLTSSPEASLKKLLTAGIGDCFEITKSFRNREAGIRNHNSEFTILEWYRVYESYQRIMTDCEELLQYILKAVVEYKSRLSPIGDFTAVQLRSTRDAGLPRNDKMLIYQGKEIDLTPPWKRISVKEAWDKFTGVPFEEICGDKDNYFPIHKIKTIAENKGCNVSEGNSWEEIFNQIFLNEIEPELCKDGQPFFLYDYPTPLAALARVKKGDPRFAERFELYIGGMEIGDCYHELADYGEQKRRLNRDAALIKSAGGTDCVIDQDFLSSLKDGLPDCSGMALGVDRLVMLFTDKDDLNDVIFFPNSEK